MTRIVQFYEAYNKEILLLDIAHHEGQSAGIQTFVCHSGNIAG